MGGKAPKNMLLVVALVVLSMLLLLAPFAAAYCSGSAKECRPHYDAQVERMVRERQYERAYQRPERDQPARRRC